MKDLDIEGVKNFLRSCEHSDCPNLLYQFIKYLQEFIDENNRLPALPQDFEHFENFPMDHLTYLIENCRKFRIINHCPDSNAVESECDSGVLAEFKAASLLAAEIQKIITRKYTPEPGKFLFQNGKVIINKTKQ